MGLQPRELQLRQLLPIDISLYKSLAIVLNQAVFIRKSTSFCVFLGKICLCDSLLILFSTMLIINNIENIVILEIIMNENYFVTLTEQEVTLFGDIVFSGHRKAITRTVND